MLRELAACGFHPLPPVPRGRPRAPARATARAWVRAPRAAARARRRAEPDDLEPEERIVFRAWRCGARHPDEIAAQTGLSVPAVQRALLTLGLKGVLVATPSRRTNHLSRRKH